jgi:hypothetical protein
VQGKGYLHPDGRVAVSRLRLDALLEYIPKGPSERVVSVDYSIGGQPRSSSSRLHAHGASAVQLPAELVNAA